MAAGDESGGGDAAHETVLAGDDSGVPIVDIPPNEDLGLSTETVAAVEAAAMEELEEALAQTGATAATASSDEIGSAIDGNPPSELVETTTVVTTTTTTITDIETVSVVLTDTPMEPISEEITTLGKREKPEEEGSEEGLGFNGDGATEAESVPPTKKVKESTDGAAVATKEDGAKNGEAEKIVEPVKLGPKTFGSGVEMFTYFYELLHAWVSNVDVNKYEFLVLSDLIKKGHRDAETKIGSGIESFQIRFHPGWHSRCYYLIRTDGTVDDFSYRKCVDKIMPLPENLFSPSGDLLVDQLLGPGEDANKWSKKNKGKDNFGDGWKSNHGGHSNRGGGRGGRGGRRGGGRGGGWSR